MVTPTRFAGSLIAAGLLLLAPVAKDATGQAREVTLTELTDASTSIVLGTCARKESFWDAGRTKILTQVTIRVEQNLKGADGAEAVVTIPGGRVGNTLYEVSDTPVFAEGETVLVFLWEHPSGLQLVTGGTQGKLQVLEDARTGRRMLPGAGRLLRNDAAGKVSAGGQQAASTMLLDDLIAEIRVRAEQ